MDAPDLATLCAIAAALALSGFAAKQDLSLPLYRGAPMIGAAVAALGALLTLTPVSWREAFAFATLATVCTLIAEIDRRRCLIPDVLVLALLALAAVAPLGLDLTEALAGGALLGAFFLAVRLAFARIGRADALGLGDVKLAAAMGALLGPQLGLVAVAAAGVATLSIAAPRLLRSGAATLSAGAPFGIGLAAALLAIAALRLWGSA